MWSGYNDEDPSQNNLETCNGVVLTIGSHNVLILENAESRMCRPHDPRIMYH